MTAKIGIAFAPLRWQRRESESGRDDAGNRFPDFIHGTLMSEWSAWWVSQWTEGKGRYCMSADEEGGIFTALPRLEAAGRVDMRRVMVLRVATDIDRQYPGETAGASLAESLDSTFGFVGLE